LLRRTQEGVHCETLAAGYNASRMRLILASNSPRRRDLLRNAGIRFELRSSGPAESAPRAGERAAHYARRMAHAKALYVAERASPGRLVLGADTVVVIDGTVLGKPRGDRDALRMLRKLSGQTHKVITGICLVQAPGKVLALRHATTNVTFRKLSERELQAYVASKEPWGKAGAYGIQGRASLFVRRISGCYSNVVGLPLGLLAGVLKTRASSNSLPRASRLPGNA